MKLCALCGSEFLARRGGRPQQYCSKDCYRSAANARRWSGRPVITAPCEICGTVTQRFNGTALCGDACRRERTLRLKREYQRSHRDACRARSLAYYQRVGSKAWERYRKARRVSPSDARFTTPAKIAARFAMFGGRCWICLSPANEADHVKPLSVGGRHLPCNIRPICGACNRSKGARWPFNTSTIK